MYAINAKSEFSALKPVVVSYVYHLLLGLSSNNASLISDLLTLIFNQCITLSCFPDESKTAKVIPLYKNGQRNIPGNYRPISVLPAISKIMERILGNQLSSYWTKSELLSNSQFGFRKFHSTVYSHCITWLYQWLVYKFGQKNV